MSHTIKMYAYNYSSNTVTSYDIVHSWNDNSTPLKGSNLGSKDYSEPVTITSGYGPEEDWYTITVDIDTIGSKGVDFFCASSQDNKSVLISIHDDHVNCEYFTQSDPDGNDPVEGDSCMDKSYR